MKEWISVDKTLPPIETMVIVSDGTLIGLAYLGLRKKGEKEKVWLGTHSDYIDGYEQSESAYFEQIIIDVVYWMPLPEAPNQK